jgi:alanyl-tRNA synthetase
LTERLYYHDSYLWDFDAQVIFRSDDGTEIELDRSAFYPTSGGQPYDLGTLGGLPVVGVEEVEERVVHRLASPLAAGTVAVHCVIDEARRLDHMRQHTGQHLLSAVMEEHFGLKTVSFHLGSDYSTVDVEPQAVSLGLLREIEALANRVVWENHVTAVTFEDAATVVGLRKAPDREGMLRIVSIWGLDRSACGGTHVGRTGEIGLIVLGRTEKIRSAMRIEFYCGERARQFLRKNAELAEQQCVELRERMALADKARAKMALELAAFEASELYRKLAADAEGRRVWKEAMETIEEPVRLRMNAFLAYSGAVALLVARQNGAVSFGAHPDVGLDCGKLMKQVIAEYGGKGGGSPKLAQGSFADREKLGEISSKLF